MACGCLLQYRLARKLAGWLWREKLAVWLA